MLEGDFADWFICGIMSKSAESTSIQTASCVEDR